MNHSKAKQKDSANQQDDTYNTCMILIFYTEETKSFPGGTWYILKLYWRTQREILTPFQSRTTLTKFHSLPYTYAKLLSSLGLSMTTQQSKTMIVTHTDIPLLSLSGQNRLIPPVNTQQHSLCQEPENKLSRELGYILGMSACAKIHTAAFSLLSFPLQTMFTPSFGCKNMPFNSTNSVPVTGSVLCLL